MVVPGRLFLLLTVLVVVQSGTAQDQQPIKVDQAAAPAKGASLVAPPIPSQLPQPPRRPPLSRDAFAQMPSVEVVPLAADARLRPNDYDEPLESLVCCTHTYTFAHPASFDYPHFSAGCEVFETDGLIIHEGMRLVVAKDGHYQVSFTASAPAMPVTLRLQLQIVGSPPFTLTFPPIQVIPIKDNKGDYVAGSWQIRHAGFSPAFAQQFCTQQIKGDTCVIRIGTARFGSLPPS